MTVAVQRIYIIVEDSIENVFFYLPFGPVYTNTNLSLIVDFQCKFCLLSVQLHTSQSSKQNKARPHLDVDTHMVNLFDGPHKCKNSSIFLQGGKDMKINNWHHDEKQRELTKCYAKQHYISSSDIFAVENWESLYVLPVNHSHFLLGNFLYNTEPFLPGLSLYGN